MAGYVLNRIPEVHRVFSSSVSSVWTKYMGTMEADSFVSRFIDEGSVKCTLGQLSRVSFNKDASTGLPISDSIATIGIEDDGDDFLVGFWIKSNKAITFDYVVELMYPVAYASTLSVEKHTERISVTSGEWVFVEQQSRVTDPDDALNYPISFTIEITHVNGGGDAEIHIGYPIIWGSLDFVKNPMLLQLYTRLPEFIRSQDSVATPFPWTLARFMEMCILHQGEMKQILDDIIYADISQGKDMSVTDSLSTLVEPTIAPRKHLFWLAQFTGTQLINPTTGVTPWANLPATWQGIDMLDEIDTVEDKAAWDIIQDSDPEPAGLEEFLRWQVVTAYYGRNAGSSQALEESVKRVLTGNKSVNLTVVSPWNLNVATSITETPDTALSSIGDSVPSILALIEPTRPLGYAVSHTLTA